MKKNLSTVDKTSLLYLFVIIFGLGRANVLEQHIVRSLALFAVSAFPALSESVCGLSVKRKHS